MRRKGQIDASEAAETALDCYMREQQVLRLRGEDIATTAEGEMSISLGVAERGESAKTGRQQGVRPDTPFVRDLLMRRKASVKPHEKIFKLNVNQYRNCFAAARKELGLPLKKPHGIRHTGPSRDAATRYRTRPQHGRRGGWLSDKSVLRYAKTHSYVGARAETPLHILGRGAKIGDGRAQRSAKSS